MLRNKITKGFLYGFLILLFLGILGLEIFARLYREKAGAYLREQFSHQSDLVLQPFETNISVWRHFPRLTFTFSNISIIDTIGPKPVQVLRLKRASVTVPLTQFRPDRLKINRVALDDLHFYEQVDSSGTKAGLRFRSNPNADTTGNKLPFLIPEIILRNVQISSQNKFKKSAYLFKVKEANLNARLHQGQIFLKGLLNGTIGHISNKRVRMFRNRPFTLNLHYQYLLNQKKAFFNQTYAVVNQDSIAISGWHIRLPQGMGSDLNLTLKGKQPMLYIFKQLLPPAAQPFLQRITSDSHMRFTYHITGTSGPRVTPRNKIDFVVQNGQFYLPLSKRYIKAVNLTGNMDNGTQHRPETSLFRISDLSARTGDGQIKVQLEVNNFIRPAFALRGQGQISLNELTGLVQLPLTAVGGGSLVGEIDFSGTLPDTLQASTPDWRGKGQVQVQNASFRPVGLTVNCRGVNGILRITNSVLQLQKLSGKVGGQPFRLSASINNYLAYLLQTPGMLTAKADIFAASLDSDWLDLESLTEQNDKSSVFPTKNQNKTSSATKSGKMQPVPDSPVAEQRDLDNLQRLRSQVNLEINNINLPGQEQLKAVKVQVNQKGRRIDLTHLRFKTNGGGRANAHGGFVLTKAGIQRPVLRVKLHYPFINLQQFMLDLAAVKRDAQKPAATETQVSATQKNRYLKEEDYLIDLHLTANRLEYLYLKGTGLNLQANLNRHRVKLSDLRVHAVGGQIDARGEMQLDAPGNNLPVKLRTEVSNIDLQRLFTLAESMELDVLSSRNIKGTANCNLNVTTTLDNTFSPSFAGTIAYAQARFKNMELIQVEPIQNALKFLRKERTQHLYFEDVNTSFIMKENYFITRRLPLNSNLTAFEMSGTYAMGGGAKLNMDINVFNVLFGNNRRRIEKIKSDSLSLNTQGRKQHLVITREQSKYKVKLSNRREREANRVALQQEFNQYLRQHQIDTVFTMQR